MKATFVVVLVFSAAFANAQTTQSVSRQEWGAPLVEISHDNNQWTIAGKKQTVTLDSSNLKMDVRADGGHWGMESSGPNDLLIKSKGEEFPLRLADAKKIEIVPYDTGFKTGVKVTLSDWARAG